MVSCPPRPRVVRCQGNLSGLPPAQPGHSIQEGCPFGHAPHIRFLAALVIFINREPPSRPASRNVSRFLETSGDAVELQLLRHSIIKRDGNNRCLQAVRTPKEIYKNIINHPGNRVFQLNVTRAEINDTLTVDKTVQGTSRANRACTSHPPVATEQTIRGAKPKW